MSGVNLLVLDFSAPPPRTPLEGTKPNVGAVEEADAVLHDLSLYLIISFGLPAASGVRRGQVQ